MVIGAAKILSAIQVGSEIDRKGYPNYQICCNFTSYNSGHPFRDALIPFLAYLITTP